MVARTGVAPPTPESKNLAEPQIDKSAYVHSFSNLIGEIKVGAKVVIAPGVSIRANEGSPFYIGEKTTIQDGVIIHGLAKGRVVGDDGQEYSVWIGKQTCITHMALIKGPVYVGDNCFIGFRSTVFNARVGAGCIVMMHALIQDVEIPPGKYVPSGAIITHQQQADRLPNVTERDRVFVNHISEINEAIQTSQNRPLSGSNKISYKKSLTEKSVGNQPPASVASKIPNPKSEIQNPMSVNTNIRAQVRSLLSQGYKIGVEHADKRRFKTSSWLSGGFITATREDPALTEKESKLREHQGEFVRLIGIDPQAKRRALEMIIQRPDDAPGETSRTTKTVHSSAESTRREQSTNGHSGNGHLNTDFVHQIRSLISQGHKIGLEFADQRRFKTSSWLTGPAIKAKQENIILKEVESVLAEHPDEYVRLIGIDTRAKKRLVETIIQRPGEKSGLGTHQANPAARLSHNPTFKTRTTQTGLNSEVISQIRSLLSSGYKIGTEHADKRRFKTSSWQSCAPINSNREAEVIAALESCLGEHQGEYVRLLGIDSHAKRRVLEMVIQRPDEKSSNGSKYTSSSASYSNPVTTHTNTNVKTRLGSEMLSQIRSLLSQGFKIGMEHADKRRFRTSSWQSCTPIDSNRESEVIAALEACMSEHQGEYVRLLGIDAGAKRRVLETIIQRP